MEPRSELVEPPVAKTDNVVERGLAVTARLRHVELLPRRRGGRVDTAFGQLGDEIGIRLIGEMARALAIVEPALTGERAGGPHDLEVDRGSGRAHVRRGEAHEFA